VPSSGRFELDELTMFVRLVSDLPEGLVPDQPWTPSHLTQ
jgi:hypothetical protein